MSEYNTNQDGQWKTSEQWRAEEANDHSNPKKNKNGGRGKYVAKLAASAVAFGEGFIPIPFSDAVVLIPTQITMIASITTNFGMSISKSVIMSFISSTIGTAGTTILGKSMVSNLFKLIPGVGTGVGGMISGSTASLLTTALGEAYIKFMEMIYKGELKKEDLYDQNGQKAISKMFKEELMKKRKQSF